MRNNFLYQFDDFGESLADLAADKRRWSRIGLKLSGRPVNSSQTAKQLRQDITKI